jgi:transcriptional regulator with XRE-family HTH domain
VERDSKEGISADRGHLPVRLVTVNQVVAWNIAWLRRETGVTQRELGEVLGWSNVSVSEAERSWDGKRTREFDAEELIALSLAFGVPLNALFLPPLDDGRDVVYLIQPPGQNEDLGMADLLGTVLFGDPDDDSAGVTAYRRRLLGAVGQYHGEDWRDEVARWLVISQGPESARERALRMRGDRARLMADADDLGAWADAFEKAAEEEGRE